MDRLECEIFGGLLERRFVAMARAEEARFAPDKRRVEGWLAASSMTAEMERRSTIQEFATNLVARMNERADESCSCGKNPAVMSRDDHATTCNRYIWTRASWVVQQELAEVTEPGD